MDAPGGADALVYEGRARPRPESVPADAHSGMNDPWSEEEALARLVDDGLVRAIVDGVLPLARAREAYRRRVRRAR
jgi:hypothetical protein